MTIDYHIGQSKIYLKFLKEVRWGKNNVIGISIENESDSIESISEDILALLIHNITADLELALNSSTKHIFINANMSNLELTKEVNRINLACSYLKSITYFYYTYD